MRKEREHTYFISQNKFLVSADEQLMARQALHSSET